MEEGLEEGIESDRIRMKPKPGKKNPVQTFELRRNAQRQAKTRKIQGLQRITEKLHRMNIEPVEVLIVVKEQLSNKYKYMGYGQMMENFEKGFPITTTVPTKKQKRKYSIFPSKESATEVTQLTPQKYDYPFLSGAGEALAASQKKMLQNIEIDTTCAKEIIRKEPGAISRKRGQGVRTRGGTGRGRGRGGRGRGGGGTGAVGKGGSGTGGSGMGGGGTGGGGTGGIGMGGGGMGSKRRSRKRLLESEEESEAEEYLASRIQLPLGEVEPERDEEFIENNMLIFDTPTDPVDPENMNAEFELHTNQTQLYHMNDNGLQFPEENIPTINIPLLEQDLCLVSNWEMANANIEEHKEKQETQVICSDQVTSRKEELQSWVNTMVTKLGDSLQHSDGAEGMEACLAKYKAIEGEMETNKINMVSLLDKTSAMQAPYPFTETVNLAKNAVVLGKKFDSVKQRGEKIEEMPQGTLEQPAEDDQQQQNRRLSAVREKIDCYGEIAGDKFSVEAKLATIVNSNEYPLKLEMSNANIEEHKEKQEAQVICSDQVTSRKEELQSWVNTMVTKLGDSLQHSDGAEGMEACLAKYKYKAIEGEMETNKVNMVSLLDKTSAMQAPYTFTETANLAKNAVVLGKKFDSVKQRGEKIEEMPQGTLEQPAEDDQQQQNRRLSAVREKIDCYGEIAGDKFSVEAKLATIVNSNEYPLKLEMSNANIEEHREQEAQVICSDQVTSRKEEPQSWVNTMVTKLGDSLQHSDDAEGMEACVAKYKAIEGEMETNKVNMVSLLDKTSAMQAPYPFTETANLAKNAVILSKKFDSVKQRGEKIEEMPQGTLEQPAEDDQQQQNRRLSAVREKIDCYGEIAGDKFSVEAKLATIVNSNEYPLKPEIANANIEEHREQEAQVICSDQVTSRKEELQSWVNTMVTKPGDSLQHSDDAEGMEACVAKYKDEAPYFQEVLSDTNQKIGDLNDTNLEREIPVLLAAQQDDEDTQYDIDWRKILPVNEKILEKLKQQVIRQRKKNQKISVGDYVLVTYKNKIKGKRILEKHFAGQVIDTMKNNDYIVSFFKNTDEKNIKKMGTIPEEYSVPPSQIVKKIKPPKHLKRHRMIVYQFTNL